MATNQDVIVIGAGIFGLSCAFACLELGLSVTVLERDKVGAGASGGIVGAMAPFVPDGWSAKKQFQLDALLSAAAFWTRIDAISGQRSGYGRIGRVQPIADELGLARALRRVKGAQQHWGENAFWRVENGWVHDDLTARIHPAQACQSLAQTFRLRGGIVTEGVEVTGLVENQVTTRTETFTARSIILAAGFGTFQFLQPYLGEGSGLGIKGQAILVRPAQMFSERIIQTDRLYLVPHFDATLAIGSTSEETWTNIEPDEKLQALLATATTQFPELAGAEILTHWAGIRPKARGRDPMVGRISSTNSLFVATGGFKTAFGIAHEVGRATARMIVGEATNLPPSFNPEYHRMKP